jgi:hypothetical protein
MKITQSNVHQIAIFGAASYWILAAICFAHDYATGQLKNHGWFGSFVFLSAFAWIAFYLILAPTLLRSVRSHRSNQTRYQIGTILWAMSPLPMLLVSASLVAYVVFRSN